MEQLGGIKRRSLYQNNLNSNTVYLKISHFFILIKYYKIETLSIIINIFKITFEKFPLIEYFFGFADVFTFK